MEKYDFYNTSRKQEFELVSKNHPNLPKSILLKADMVRRGVTFNEGALEMIREQENDIKLSHTIFFQHHKIDQPELLPADLMLNDGTIVLVCAAPKDNDPYIIDFIEGKFYVMLDGEGSMEEVRCFRKPNYYDKKTSSGEWMKYIGFNTGCDCILVNPYRHCHYWNDGNQCVFCDMPYNMKFQMKMGRGFKTRCTPEDIYETIKEALKQKGKWRHFMFTGGSDPRNEYKREFEYQLEIVKAINRAGKDMGIEEIPQWCIASPFTEEELIQLKKAGLTAFGVFIETWDKENFKHTCPGKEKNQGYDHFVQTALKAVKIFGRGNVIVGFVPGVEMMPEPYGFGDDIDKAVSSTLEGYEFLNKNGVAVSGTALTIEPGTTLYKIGATPPPLEFYARLSEGRLRILKKYKLFSKTACWRHTPYGLSPDVQRYV
ncbi:MAG: radical SAM protein [Thermodesulfobacteriota bacterium]|nr:radical SAM protein [Thermodesulfobacteriota bacterium]